MGRREAVKTDFKLTGDDDIQINIVCYKDVGVWTNRNEKSKEIAKLLVKDISRRCNHSRKHMANPHKWTKIIERYKILYNLQGGKVNGC